MSHIPETLKYTKDHEWVKIEGDVVTIGVTDYAQGELGDVVFVELPEVGDTVEREETFGSIEAVKAVADIFSPVSGEALEINPALEDDPEIVNKDPYGEGWMLKIKLSDHSELEELMDSAAYRDLIGL
jgi:glycine cleavage system H protein